jgi:hypothetical protein
MMRWLLVQFSKTGLCLHPDTKESLFPGTTRYGRRT